MHTQEGDHYRCSPMWNGSPEITALITLQVTPRSSGHVTFTAVVVEMQKLRASNCLERPRIRRSDGEAWFYPHVTLPSPGHLPGRRGDRIDRREFEGGLSASNKRSHRTS